MAFIVMAKAVTISPCESPIAFASISKSSVVIFFMVGIDGKPY
jgi:hypothetical protein